MKYETDKSTTENRMFKILTLKQNWTHIPGPIVHHSSEEKKYFIKM